MNTIYKFLPTYAYNEWSRYFLAVNKPNLTQSWSYGNAKMKSQHWKLIRGIIYENDQSIALIQVWYKKFLFIKFVRLSYGPLWIMEHPPLEQVRGVFDAIKKYWNLRTLSVLSIAPNLENLPDYQATLSSLGFYRRKCISYESGLINLKQSALDLRLNLRQNWRNQLNSSEKKELIFHSSQEYSDFQWLISCFNILRKEKNFYGHSIGLLEALHYFSFEHHETSVAIVSHGAERVAGILIACHGSSCTPLIIWVNERGRSLNAGNFLLWNSVLYAKSKGCLWFDLGGTNGATKFKMGLPHQRYQMIGEYYTLL